MTRYVVEEKLASGGMGTVYRVLDTVTGQKLALKRLTSEATKRLSTPAPSSIRPGGALSSASKRSLALESFEREYQVLASLEHPRIIRVYDYGVDELGPYYTMELIDGQDLRHGAPLAYREACLYLRDVAASLALLHARRLIHRDISAANVRRTGVGHCKVLDFGALTSFGRPASVVGTPPAVPPEAMQDAPLDQRADLYSLGALAYWLLTGQHAYPARQLSALVECWNQPPKPPSTVAAGVPVELDELVMSLLSLEPLGRPGSAGEVIARLNVIAELPEEETIEAERLAQSFLLKPPFTGRTTQMAYVQSSLSSLPEGRAGALCVHAVSGMGRTRLLEEAAVRAQLAGATVLRADARMYGERQGVGRALVARLFDAMPELARERSTWDDGTAAGLDARFVEVSRVKPLAILVDNVEAADDASLALLASLAKSSRENPLLVVVTERTSPEATDPPGLVALRKHAKVLELTPLASDDMIALMSSLFGDATNVKRFGAWIHERSLGSPLHAVEIVRMLVAKHVVRYSGGIWTVAVDRPDANLPAALEDMLAMRIAMLSDASRRLAECLSLQRERPTRTLCRLIARPADDAELSSLLHELMDQDVLCPEGSDYRFTSAALCQVLLSSMDSRRLEQNHRRVGEALAELAGSARPGLTIQAGWHLIQGGDGLRGADMIAGIARDPVVVRTLLADLHRAGRPFEAALATYNRHRRSAYERLPLLSSVAQAGYYEDLALAERHADAALDVLEFASGLHTARRLRRFVGAWLSLVIGVLLARMRFRFVPRDERAYSFTQLLTHLFSTVTALSAAAAVSLDSERGERCAAVLEPFSVLPRRTTPVGVYEYCKGLSRIARDDAPLTHDTFDELLTRFEDPNNYPTMPADARKVYIAGAHFARGVFAIFRAHGEKALESADALDGCGMRLYATIASQLRSLYHMNRGELAEANEHREQFELRAAELGALWQVETWEGPALILVYTSLADIVSSTRVLHRLELMSRSVPSLRRYANLAGEGLMRARRDPKYLEVVSEEYGKDEPRSYIGWGATMALWAAGYNALGRHREAKRICETTLAHLSDADREYVALFLNLDVQLAIADAGLRQFPAALARLDALLERFADANHPMACGVLHETRARICFASGDLVEYQRSLAAVERWFVGTGTPLLIARYKRLVELAQEPGSAPQAAPAGSPSSAFFSPGSEFLTRTLCDPELTSPVSEY